MADVSAPRLAAGDAVAVGGIVLAAFTLMDSAGPGYQRLLAGSPGNDEHIDRLRYAEAVTAVVVGVAAISMAVLTRRWWPVVVGALAVGVACATNEHALRRGFVSGVVDDDDN